MFERLCIAFLAALPLMVMAAGCGPCGPKFWLDDGICFHNDDSTSEASNASSSSSGSTESITTDSTMPTGTESTSDPTASTGPAACGDGQLDPGEECDDGNATPGDGCEPDCTTAVPPSCGDGQLDRGEQCDDGNDETTDACVACKDAACGDGFVQEGVETCDDGADNGIYGFCNSACDGPGPRCGDQDKDGPEECDDGNQVDDDGCSNDCIAPRLVFVTSGTFYGNLGGLTGADAKCTAAAGGLGAPESEWRAWLSDDTGSPSTRMDTGYTGWYKLVDGALIAHGWEDLTDGTLAAAIDLTESGAIPPDKLSAWTNTQPDGTVADVANHCMSWTVDSDALSALRGSAISATVTWTSNGAAPCNLQSRLYCFQHTL